MNRRLTALFAALEALLVVGVGVGIPLVPLTLLWAIQYGLTIDWIVFWRAAVDVWLLGHGVDIRFTLDPVIAASSGFPGAAEPFTVTIAPLAFALITVLLGVRAGRRIGETPHHHIGRLTGLVVFAGLSLAVAFTALSADARPSLVQSTLLPTLVFGLGLVIGSERARRATERFGHRAGDAGVGSLEPRSAVAASSRVDAGAGSLEPGSDRSVSVARARLTAAQWPAAASSAVRLTGRRASAWLRNIIGGPTLQALRVAAIGGAAAAALVLAISAVTVAVLLAVSYAQIIALYQAVQSGILGGVTLTVGQLAFIPNLVIWAASWFTGPGFALGAGSTVSPLGTDLGPLPAVPLFGAFPAGQLDLAFAGLLVPVLAGFLTAAVLRSGLERAGVHGPLRLAATGLAMGFVGGIVLGALAWVSSGSAGPGRLVEVGPSPLLVGCWASLEIGVAAAIALAVGGIRSAAGPAIDSDAAAVADPSPGSGPGPQPGPLAG